MSGPLSPKYTITLNASPLCPSRMTVLLLVCLTQSWLLWKFIRFQLRRWREFRHEQAVRKKTATKQALRPLKRDSRECERRLKHAAHWCHQRTTFVRNATYFLNKNARCVPISPLPSPAFASSLATIQSKTTSASPQVWPRSSILGVKFPVGKAGFVT